MPKKSLAILLSAIGIIIIAGGVVAALVLVKGSQNGEQAFVEKDLGACSTISVDSVKDALKGTVESVGAPINQGYAYDPDGEIQTCRYSLSAENNDEYRNLTVSVTVFKSADLKTSAVDRFSQLESLGGVGEATYFDTVQMEASDDIPAHNLYRLYAFKDMKLYGFTIGQLDKGDVFTNATAQAALLQIAKTATL